MASVAHMLNQPDHNHLGAGADTCQVCGDEPSVGVASVPGLPVSVAYGRRCLETNAHPYPLLVTNVAICGGELDGLADWFQDMVRDTCERLGVSLDRFKADAATEFADLERASTERE